MKVDLGKSFEKFKTMITEETALAVTINLQALVETLYGRQIISEESFKEAMELIKKAYKEAGFKFPSSLYSKN